MSNPRQSKQHVKPPLSFTQSQQPTAAPTSRRTLLHNDTTGLPPILNPQTRVSMPQVTSTMRQPSHTPGQPLRPNPQTVHNLNGNDLGDINRIKRQKPNQPSTASQQPHPSLNHSTPNHTNATIFSQQAYTGQNQPTTVRRGPVTPMYTSNHALAMGHSAPHHNTPHTPTPSNLIVINSNISEQPPPPQEKPIVYNHYPSFQFSDYDYYFYVLYSTYTIDFIAKTLQVPVLNHSVAGSSYLPLQHFPIVYYDDFYEGTPHPNTANSTLISPQHSEMDALYDPTSILDHFNHITSEPVTFLGKSPNKPPLDLSQTSPFLSQFDNSLYNIYHKPRVSPVPIYNNFINGSLHQFKAQQTGNIGTIADNHLVSHSNTHNHLISIPNCHKPHQLDPSIITNNHANGCYNIYSLPPQLINEHISNFFLFDPSRSEELIRAGKNMQSDTFFNEPQSYRPQQSTVWSYSPSIPVPISSHVVRILSSISSYNTSNIPPTITQGTQNSHKIHDYSLMVTLSSKNHSKYEKNDDSSNKRYSKDANGKFLIPVHPSHTINALINKDTFSQYRSYLYNEKLAPLFDKTVNNQGCIDIMKYPPWVQGFFADDITEGELIAYHKYMHDSLKGKEMKSSMVAFATQASKLTKLSGGTGKAAGTTNVSGGNTNNTSKHPTKFQSFDDLDYSQYSNLKCNPEVRQEYLTYETIVGELKQLRKSHDPLESYKLHGGWRFNPTEYHHLYYNPPNQRGNQSKTEKNTKEINEEKSEQLDKNATLVSQNVQINPHLLPFDRYLILVCYMLSLELSTLYKQCYNAPNSSESDQNNENSFLNDQNGGILKYYIKSFGDLPMLSHLDSSTTTSMLNTLITPQKRCVVNIANIISTFQYITQTPSHPLYPLIFVSQSPSQNLPRPTKTIGQITPQIPPPLKPPVDEVYNALTQFTIALQLQYFHNKARFTPFNHMPLQWRYDSRYYIPITNPIIDIIVQNPSDSDDKHISHLQSPSIMSQYVNQQTNMSSHNELIDSWVKTHYKKDIINRNLRKIEELKKYIASHPKDEHIELIKSYLNDENVIEALKTHVPSSFLRFLRLLVLIKSLRKLKQHSFVLTADKNELDLDTALIPDSIQLSKSKQKSSRNSKKDEKQLDSLQNTMSPSPVNKYVLMLQRQIRRQNMVATLIRECYQTYTYTPSKNPLKPIIKIETPSTPHNPDFFSQPPEIQERAEKFLNLKQKKRVFNTFLTKMLQTFPKEIFRVPVTRVEDMSIPTPPSTGKDSGPPPQLLEPKTTTRFPGVYLKQLSIFDLYKHYQTSVPIHDVNTTRSNGEAQFSETIDKLLSKRNILDNNMSYTYYTESHQLGKISYLKERWNASTELTQKEILYHFQQPITNSPHIPPYRGDKHFNHFSLISSLTQLMQQQNPTSAYSLSNSGNNSPNTVTPTIINNFKGLEKLLNRFHAFLHTRQMLDSLHPASFNDISSIQYDYMVQIENVFMEHLSNPLKKDQHVSNYLDSSKNSLDNGQSDIVDDFTPSKRRHSKKETPSKDPLHTETGSHLNELNDEMYRVMNHNFKSSNFHSQQPQSSDLKFYPYTTPIFTTTIDTPNINGLYKHLFETLHTRDKSFQATFDRIQDILMKIGARLTENHPLFPQEKYCWESVGEMVFFNSHSDFIIPKYVESYVEMQRVADYKYNLSKDEKVEVLDGLLAQILTNGGKTLKKRPNCEIFLNPIGDINSSNCHNIDIDATKFSKTLGVSPCISYTLQSYHIPANPSHTISTLLPPHLLAEMHTIITYLQTQQAYRYNNFVHSTKHSIRPQKLDDNQHLSLYALAPQLIQHLYTNSTKTEFNIVYYILTLLTIHSQNALLFRNNEENIIFNKTSTSAPSMLAVSTSHNLVNPNRGTTATTNLPHFSNTNQLQPNNSQQQSLLSGVPHVNDKTLYSTFEFKAINDIVKESMGSSSDINTFEPQPEHGLPCLHPLTSQLVSPHTTPLLQYAMGNQSIFLPLVSSPDCPLDHNLTTTITHLKDYWTKKYLLNIKENVEKLYNDKIRDWAGNVDLFTPYREDFQTKIPLKYEKSLLPGFKFDFKSLLYTYHILSKSCSYPFVQNPTNTHIKTSPATPFISSHNRSFQTIFSYVFSEKYTTQYADLMRLRTEWFENVMCVPYTHSYSQHLANTIATRAKTPLFNSKRDKRMSIQQYMIEQATSFDFRRLPLEALQPGLNSPFESHYYYTRMRNPFLNPTRLNIMPTPHPVFIVAQHKTPLRWYGNQTYYDKIASKCAHSGYTPPHDEHMMSDEVGFSIPESSGLSKKIEEMQEVISKCDSMPLITGPRKRQRRSTGSGENTIDVLDSDYPPNTSPAPNVSVNSSFSQNSASFGHFGDFMTYNGYEDGQQYCLASQQSDFYRDTVNNIPDNKNTTDLTLNTTHLSTQHSSSSLNAIPEHKHPAPMEIKLAAFFLANRAAEYTRTTTASSTQSTLSLTDFRTNIAQRRLLASNTHAGPGSRSLHTQLNTQLSSHSISPSVPLSSTPLSQATKFPLSLNQHPTQWNIINQQYKPSYSDIIKGSSSNFKIINNNVIFVPNQTHGTRRTSRGTGTDPSRLTQVQNTQQTTPISPRYDNYGLNHAHNTPQPTQNTTQNDDNTLLYQNKQDQRKNDISISKHSPQIQMNDDIEDDSNNGSSLRSDDGNGCTIGANTLNEDEDDPLISPYKSPLPNRDPSNIRDTMQDSDDCPLYSQSTQNTQNTLNTQGIQNTHTQESIEINRKGVVELSMDTEPPNRPHRGRKSRVTDLPPVPPTPVHSIQISLNSTKISDSSDKNYSESEKSECRDVPAPLIKTKTCGGVQQLETQNSVETVPVNSIRTTRSRASATMTPSFISTRSKKNTINESDKNDRSDDDSSSDQVSSSQLVLSDDLSKNTGIFGVNSSKNAPKGKKQAATPLKTTPKSSKNKTQRTKGRAKANECNVSSSDHSNTDNNDHDDEDDAIFSEQPPAKSPSAKSPSAKSPPAKSSRKNNIDPIIPAPTTSFLTQHVKSKPVQPAARNNKTKKGRKATSTLYTELSSDSLFSDRPGAMQPVKLARSVHKQEKNITKTSTNTQMLDESD